MASSERTHEQNLEYLDELSEINLPSFVEQMSEEQVRELRAYIDDALEVREAGLNKMFESFSIVLKYIPNFLIHSIGPKYTTPELAARMTGVLPPKQAAALAGGFPVEYMGEVTKFADPVLAGEIMMHLKDKVLFPVTDYTYKHHPLKGLDILNHLDDKQMKRILNRIDFSIFDDMELSEHRRKVVERAVKLKGRK